MIVRDRSDHLVLVRQTDHAHLTGLFASALSTVPEPRRSFERAAREHDRGWAEHDASPTVDPTTGRPHTYRNMPRPVYRDIWRAGIRAAFDDDPYAGLLVSLHGMQFFAAKDADGDASMYERERDRQDRELREQGLGGSWDDLPDEVRVHHEMISFLDALSLFVCDEWDTPWTTAVLGDDVTVIRRVRVARDGHDDETRDHITVDPWPFGSAPIEFHVPAVRVDATSYAGSRELNAAIAEGVPLVLDGVLVRAPG